MFGYVISDMTRMDADMKRRYKDSYCGLCHALSREYGARSRFILNYDTSFMLTVLSALENEKCTESMRCPYRFGKRRECTAGAKCDYAADVTVLLSYLKFADDVADDNSLVAKLMTRVYKKSFDKACDRQPHLAGRIEEHLLRLRECERHNCTDPLIPADIFGALLGDVFGTRAYDFGYHLGRFIYLCDAACDLKSDIRRRRYNPLVRLKRADIHNLLGNTMSDCIDAYQALDIKRDNDIIENVLYHGVWLKYDLRFKTEHERSV